MHKKSDFHISMAWQVGDEVSSMDVLWSAAARIGQERQREELQRIVDYLVKCVNHWIARQRGWLVD